jgi:integrase
VIRGEPRSHRADAGIASPARLRDRAEVPNATLHRLRHNVATFLVARGEILQAQARLGHADAATTLREYAYALPPTDQNAADAIDHHLDHLDPHPNARDRSEI